MGRKPQSPAQTATKVRRVRDAVVALGGPDRVGIKADVAEYLGWGERTVERYWRLAMDEPLAVPEVSEDSRGGTVNGVRVYVEQRTGPNGEPLPRTFTDEVWRQIVDSYPKDWGLKRTARALDWWRVDINGKRVLDVDRVRRFRRMRPPA